MRYTGNEEYEINIGSIKGTFNKNDLLELVQEVLDFKDVDLQKEVQEIVYDYGDTEEEINYRDSYEDCPCSEGDYESGFEDGAFEAWEQYDRQKSQIKSDLDKIIRGWS